MVTIIDDKLKENILKDDVTKQSCEPEVKPTKKIAIVGHGIINEINITPLAKRCVEFKPNRSQRRAKNGVVHGDNKPQTFSKNKSNFYGGMR